MRRAALFVSLLVSVGCGSKGRGSEAEGSGPGSAGETGTDEGASSTSGAPDGLVLRAEPAGSTYVAPVLEARGAGVVRIASAVRVERQEGERWTDAGVTGLALRATCEQPAERCVSLARGGSLRPPPWNGRVGRGQCGCPSCAPAPTGTYRFVVSTCEGGHDVPSRPFHVGP